MAVSYRPYFTFFTHHSTCSGPLPLASDTGLALVTASPRSPNEQAQRRTSASTHPRLYSAARLPPDYDTNRVHTSLQDSPEGRGRAAAIGPSWNAKVVGPQATRLQSKYVKDFRRAARSASHCRYEPRTGSYAPAAATKECERLRSFRFEIVFRIVCACLSAIAAPVGPKPWS